MIQYALHDDLIHMCSIYIYPLNYSKNHIQMYMYTNTVLNWTFKLVVFCFGLFLHFMYFCSAPFQLALIETSWATVKGWHSRQWLSSHRVGGTMAWGPSKFWRSNWRPPKMVNSLWFMDVLVGKFSHGPHGLVLSKLSRTTFTFCRAVVQQVCLKVNTYNI